MLESRPEESRSRRRRGRVVLLLDLDCFYAQCETIRLGLDPKMPLALLQWNSALAVNYPARALGVKRGDSFEAIREKSEGKCVALHLPVIPVSKAATATAAARAGSPGSGETGGVEGDDDGRASETDLDRQSPATGAEPPSSLDETYAAEFRLPPDVRGELFLREKNRMRRPHEGKASLERYRLASAAIFRVVTEALIDRLGRDGFVLERASIDELFLDVSDHCYDLSRPEWAASSEGDGEGRVTEGGSSGETKKRPGRSDDDDDVGELARSETVVCGVGTFTPDEEDEDVRALRRGCAVARGLRKAVYDRLGFTLSAGVSTNKMMSKLGASYGKPNGQAVIFPQAMAEVLKNTEIRKVRNLGGKVGKKVIALLPTGEATMASVAKFLTLDELVRSLGNESGRHVFDAARGIDNEPVTETKGALTKSITAFKSFPKTHMEGLEKWVLLLATDVCGRVKLDSKRNDRYPKLCNIQYIHSEGDNRVSRSLRVPFPKLASGARQEEELVKKVKDALIMKGRFPVQRLGLSAMGFEARPKSGAIESFFRSNAKSKETELNSLPELKEEQQAARKGAQTGDRTTPLHCHDDMELAMRIQEQFESEEREGAKTATSSAPADNLLNTETEDGTPPSREEEPKEEQQTSSEGAQREQKSVPSQCHDDMEIARRMQEQFDTVESEEAKRTSSSDPATTSPNVSPVGKMISCCEEGSDLAYARKLQALYDRENSALSALENHSAGGPKKRTSPKGWRSASASASKPPKKNRIEKFFKKMDR